MKLASKLCKAAAALCLTLAAAQPALAGGTLYDKLGQEPGITAVIDKFIGIVAADARINHFFGHANVPRLKALLVQLLGMASGGPQKYAGRDMKTSHAGMGVRVADFNALAEDLYLAMDQSNVPFTTQQKVMAMLAPMESDIVTQ
jgi:hemoglobin